MDVPPTNFTVDYQSILPIQQKRTIAFVNNFVMNTVSFLNHFAQSCESRLMEFEYKVQKVEAGLMILESQLASIQGINENDETPIKESNNSVELPSIVTNQEESDKIDSVNEPKGIIACQDERFAHFFKMVQVGVPAQAVKNKMIIEGVDPNILDTPNAVID
ncbi:WASH complex subunit 3 [Onthophagus taurus]|uniref:WASH complex subunit 3 n=1 Tax=Onthophagus taurus TaxID=166361 RepID=UPI000C200792|nr:WASH complex subunit 3 [Onthophagus taurus]